MPTDRLTTLDLSRRFHGVQALDGAGLAIAPGEIHALVGENGAGKSTLIRIVAGVLAADRGQVLLDGDPLPPADPVAARRRGVVTVFQESEFFPVLSVAENMAIPAGLPVRSWGLVDWPTVARQARAAMAAAGEPIDVHQPAGRLSIARRQILQVAAAVEQQVRLLILDEPTSALSDREARWLHTQIRRLQQAGAAILYVSHRQDEVFELADRISVLRDGQMVWTGRTADTNRAAIVRWMVGREMPESHRTFAATPDSPSATAPPRLELRAVDDSAGRFHEVSLSIAAGQIVGLYGLVGAGRTELAQAIFGARPLAGGVILIDGQPRTVRSPSDAVAAGIAYLPEDRLRDGICAGRSLLENLVLACLGTGRFGRWRWRHQDARNAAAESVAALNIRTTGIDQPIGQLSGGNQQKAVLGRWLLASSNILLLDEPTRGIDVAAKAEVHARLRQLADDGRAILLISSELPELLAHADSIHVLREGRIQGPFDPTETSSEQLAAAALPADAAVSDAVPAGSAVEQSARGAAAPHRSWPLRAEWGLAVAVALLGGWLTTTSPGFSWLSIGSAASIWILLGLAAATPIMAGGIDISIGSMVGLSAAGAALVLQIPAPAPIIIPLAVAAACLLGLGGGLLNAQLALTGRLHPIVVTLGTMTIFRGLILTMMGRKAMTGLPASYSRLAFDPATGLRGSLCLAVVVAVAMAIWLGHRPSGRRLLAWGGSPAAARLAGISQRRTWRTAFGLGGFLAGLSGALQLAQSGQMQAQLGAGWELTAITVAVVGGASISGGRGSVGGIVLAAVLLRLVNSALVRWGVADDQFELLVGALLLAAVLGDLLLRRAQRLEPT